jgi:nucleotide-binding universal stress UspA family protein
MNAAQEATKPTRLVIGYDGSEAAAVAINDLARGGFPEAGVAVVISVADATAIPQAAYQPVIAGSPGFADYGWIGPIEWQRLLDDAKEHAVKEAARGATLVKAALPGWDVTADHAIDTAYRALIERAQTSRADLIVVGSHGRSAVGRAALSSAVPTVAISYSHKTQGIMGLMQQDERVVRIGDLTADQCLQKLRETWQCRQQVAEALRARLPDVQRLSDRNVEMLRALLQQAVVTP